MTGSGHFNVTAAGGLVLGGIAALLLATVVALGGYGRPGAPAASVSASGLPAQPPAAGGALPAAEVEYFLDTDEPATIPGPRAR